VTALQVGDYIGTFVFAVTGALAAAEKRLDIGGFVLLAFATGVGGGALRDVLLDRGVVFWAQDPVYIVVCALAAGATYLAAERFEARRRALVWADALGLALFCVIGAAIAWTEDARPLVAVLMGALTATGGGVVRDVIRNELPLVLHREIYVTAALAGAAICVALAELDVPLDGAMIAGFLGALALRAAGILMDWHLPTWRPASERAP
jgi:uncharacterized membrane protein YeiH